MKYLRWCGGKSRLERARNEQVCYEMKMNKNISEEIDDRPIISGSEQHFCYF